jgi:anhydro-N-acetylmuramic acid kinase
MSGTSTDGIDVVALEFAPQTDSVANDGGASVFAMKAIGGHAASFEPSLRDRLLALQDTSYTSQSDDLLQAELACNELSLAYANAVQALLAKLNIEPHMVGAIGAHGQTVRHRPDLGIALQLFNPSIVAEQTNIAVVSDFRRRDVAAKGQGAPLVPAFHAEWLKSVGLSQAILLNVGGFSNLTVIEPQTITGSDCGPGNVLLDAWAQRHLGASYDDQGAWAASGHIHSALLAHLFEHPFFSRQLPCSTGKDEFHLQWLGQCIERLALRGSAISPVDVQATLLEFTVQSILRAVNALDGSILTQTLIICGGGAYNRSLTDRLQEVLPHLKVAISTDYHLLPEWVEASAFAWMARQTLFGQPSNIPKVTGAAGQRVLGSITLA